MSDDTATATRARPCWLRDDALLTVEDLHCSFKTAAGRVHGCASGSQAPEIPPGPAPGHPRRGRVAGYPHPLP